MSTEPKLGTCSNPRHAPGSYLVRNPHEKLDDCDDWREVESAPAQPAFSKGYKHRHGEPVSDACGDGRHSECTQDLTKCHCTCRGGHITPHAYMSYPAVPPAAETAEQLAQLFHETYERLAPQFGYATRKASAKPWADVPDRNKALMTAVCAELAAHVREAAQRVTCGGNVASVGGCRKDISLLEAYRCSDCELYFHRDCLRDHCETSSYVTAIRANKELIEGWKKEVKQSQASAETAERKLAELDKALQSALFPLAVLVQSGECVAAATALNEELKLQILTAHDDVYAALASLRAESKEG